MHFHDDPQTVLIIDDEDSFSTSLGRSFRDLGFSVWLSADLAQAAQVCESATPSLIVTELRIQGTWAFDFLGNLPRDRKVCPAVIATAYPSVATAVQATRTGISGYLAKPVTARHILESVAMHEPDAPPARADVHAWPSLDRTIWEYINQVFVTAGTMSEAARRLGLDRRSLRRMLAKYPPAR